MSVVVHLWHCQPEIVEEDLFRFFRNYNYKESKKNIFHPEMNSTPGRRISSSSSSSATDRNGVARPIAGPNGGFSPRQSGGGVGGARHGVVGGPRHSIVGGQRQSVAAGGVFGTTASLDEVFEADGPVTPRSQAGLLTI